MSGLVDAGLVDAVARIKADGARVSPDDVLKQVRCLPAFANATLSQVRRAITKAPKADAETIACFG